MRESFLLDFEMSLFLNLTLEKNYAALLHKWQCDWTASSSPFIKVLFVLLLRPSLSNTNSDNASNIQRNKELCMNKTLVLFCLFVFSSGTCCSA